MSDCRMFQLSYWKTPLVYLGANLLENLFWFSVVTLIIQLATSAVFLLRDPTIRLAIHVWLLDVSTFLLGNSTCLSGGQFVGKFVLIYLLRSQFVGKFVLIFCGYINYSAGKLHCLLEGSIHLVGQSRLTVGCVNFLIWKLHLFILGPVCWQICFDFLWLHQWQWLWIFTL